MLALGFSDPLKDIPTTVGEGVSRGRGETGCGTDLSNVLDGIGKMFCVTVTEDLVNDVFSNIKSAPTPSLISSICRWDNELKPRNLLALKIAIDQDWKSIKEMSGNGFLNYAGSYTDQTE